MAKIYLGATDTGFNIVNNGSEVFGTTGDQSINIAAGLTGVTMDSQVEGATFAGALADYTFKQVGVSLEVYKGGVLVTTFDSPNQTPTFSDGEQDIGYASGVITIGGTDLTDGADPVPAGGTTPTTVAEAQTAFDDAVAATATAKAAYDAAAADVSTAELAAASKTAADAYAAATATETAAATTLKSLTAATAETTDDAAGTTAEATATTDATASAAAVAAADAAVTAAADAGTTYVLTTSNDTFVGTAKNDTFTADSTTIAAGDTIIDQSSTDNDTLNMTLTATNAALKVSGVENVNADWNAFGTAAIDATNISGATITGTSTKTGFLGSMTVTAAAANTIVAGSGMDGTLTVNGATTSVVNGGEAKTVVVQASGTAANDVSANVTAGTNTTSVTVGTTNGFKTTTVDAGTATTISLQDQGNTTDTTSVTVGASAAITLANTGSTSLVVNTDALTSTATLTTIGQGLTISGTAASHTLKAVANGLTAETIINSMDTGTLTVAINGAIGADADLSKVAADNFTIDTAFSGDAAVAVATGSSIDASVNLANGEFGVLAANDSTADTLTITNTVATQTIIQADGLDATLGDIETLTIATNAAAVANAADATYTKIEAGTNKVVLTGDNDITVTAITAKTVDATAMTTDLTISQTAAETGVDMDISGAIGKNIVAFSSTTADNNYVGQDGIDTVTFATTIGSAVGVIGAGDNSVTANAVTTGDLVVISGGGDDTVSATALTTGNVTLELGDGTNTVTLGANTTLAGATVSVTTGAGVDTVTIDDDTNSTDSITLALGDGEDTLNLTTDMSAGTWSISGLDTIAIASANTAAIIGAEELTDQSYKITGDGTATDHMGVAITATGTFDFSAVQVDQTITKGLAGLGIVDGAGVDTTITGTNFADAITAAAGTNSITGGQGADTIVGGAGTDTFVVASGDTGKTAATIDTITTAWTSGTDKISWGVAGTATNYAEAAGTTAINTGTDDAATMTQMLAQADAAMNGTVVYFITDNATTNAGLGANHVADAVYAFFDRNADGTTDEVIQLVGTSFSAYDYGDFTA